MTDRYDSVLLEGIRSDFKAVAEEVELTRESLGQKMESLEMRMTTLETELVSTRVGLSAKIDKIGVRLDGHDEEVAFLKKAQNLG